MLRHRRPLQECRPAQRVLLRLRHRRRLRLWFLFQFQFRFRFRPRLQLRLRLRLRLRVRPAGNANGRGGPTRNCRPCGTTASASAAPWRNWPASMASPVSGFRPCSNWQRSDSACNAPHHLLCPPEHLEAASSSLSAIASCDCRSCPQTRTWQGADYCAIVARRLRGITLPPSNYGQHPVIAAGCKA